MRIRSAADVGHLVKTYRLARGLNQTELARLAGTKQPWISEVERGKSSAELARVLHLLSVLDVTLAASLPGEPPPQPVPDNSDLDYPDPVAAAARKRK